MIAIEGFVLVANLIFAANSGDRQDSWSLALNMFVAGLLFGDIGRELALMWGRQ